MAAENLNQMTYEQATQQALQLRKQGLTYPKIAEHLKAAGYRSPYSRGEIGHLAVRQMVIKAEKSAEKVEETKVSEVRAPKVEIFDAMKELLAVKSLSPEVKLRLIQHMLKTADLY